MIQHCAHGHQRIDGPLELQLIPVIVDELQRITGRGPRAVDGSSTFRSYRDLNPSRRWTSSSERTVSSAISNFCLFPVDGSLSSIEPRNARFE